MLGTTLCILRMFGHLILLTILWDGYYYFLHLPDVENWGTEDKWFAQVVHTV